MPGGSLTNRDKILYFLKSNSGNGYCDDCLSAKLNISPRQQVNQICRQLHTAGIVFREVKVCSECGKNKVINHTEIFRVSAEKPQLPPMEKYSVSTEWVWEGNILEKIIEYMVNVEGFEILMKGDASKSTSRPDILARKGNILRCVEVKGYPSQRHTPDFLGGQGGELKRTPPLAQARDWFSEGLFELILRKSENVQIALGLPEFRIYFKLLNQIKFFREKMELYCYLVNRDGGVKLIRPDENVKENFIKNALTSFSEKIKRCSAPSKSEQEKSYQDPYSNLERLIKNQQPIYSLNNLQIYDVKKATKGRIRAYAYIDNLKNIYKLLPEECVKTCMNRIIEYIFNKTWKTASVNECLQAWGAPDETFMTSILLLHTKGIISLPIQSGKVHIKLLLSHEHLKALGFKIQRESTKIYKPLSERGVEIVGEEYKQIFNTLAEEERKRLQLFQEG